MVIKGWLPPMEGPHKHNKKGWKQPKKCFNQLLGARSTQKLVTIHNIYSLQKIWSKHENNPPASEASRGVYWNQAHFKFSSHSSLTSSTWLVEDSSPDQRPWPLSTNTRRDKHTERLGTPEVLSNFPVRDIYNAWSSRPLYLILSNIHIQTFP